MESFLVPGTIILIDGRTNNALYFKRKLYRKWKYKFIKSYDQHIFELKDKPLGKYNKTLLNFYKSKKNLMYKVKPRIYFLIETKKREFDSRIYFATKAAASDFL